MSRPRIAFVPGDANGIGPELTAKVLSSPPADIDVLLIGDGEVVRHGEEIAGAGIDRVPVSEEGLAEPWPSGKVAFLRRDGVGRAGIELGVPDAACGRASLAELDEAALLAQRGVVDAVCFAPLNKEAMKAGGMAENDELTHLARVLGHDGHVSEINIMDAGIWTSRVTSHIPLGEVAGAITRERIKLSARLIEAALRAAGTPRPRVVVAALNPHAGDGGNFGREEIDTIAPAVAELCAEGMAALGPWPADTMFRRAIGGEADAIVTMYHDQGQIALKLTGFERGVSVLGGLPVPVTTPAHGTAFDIAGRNRAFVTATQAALAVATRMAAGRRVAAGEASPEA